MKRRLLLVLCLIAGTLGAIAPAITRADDNTPPIVPAATNCNIVVPNDPLSAQGLATPYILQGCTETNPDESAFVQAAIIDPQGQISIYGPLVIQEGRTPKVPPVVPVIAPGSTVGIWFGFNGDTLSQVRGGRDRMRVAVAATAAAQQGNCVTGLGDSAFGQFSHCNAPAFFQAANIALWTHKLLAPPLGNDAHGNVCPTVRSFKIADQDPSDNVQTQYLFNGRDTIQNTSANRAAFPSWKVMSNPSDNRLLSALVDPRIGCTPWRVTDLADPGGPKVEGLPLNEIQGALFQSRPVAYVPLGDPMTLVNGQASERKTNLYRAGVDQRPVSDTARGSDGYYCEGLRETFPRFAQEWRTVFTAAPSPDPAAANSFFTFLAARFVATFETEMRRPCEGRDPVKLITNRNGVVVDATINVRGDGDRAFLLN